MCESEPSGGKETASGKQVVSESGHPCRESCGVRGRIFFSLSLSDTSCRSHNMHADMKAVAQSIAVDRVVEEDEPLTPR